MWVSSLHNLMNVWNFAESVWRSHPWMVGIGGLLFGLYRAEARVFLEKPFRKLWGRVESLPAMRQRELEYAQESTHHLVLILAWFVVDGAFSALWWGVVVAVANHFFFRTLPFMLWPTVLGIFSGTLWRLRDFIKEVMQNPREGL
jgi:hypothetical protein